MRISLKASKKSRRDHRLFEVTDNTFTGTAYGYRRGFVELAGREMIYAMVSTVRR